MIGYSNGLAALGLLSGTDVTSALTQSFASVKIESTAQRKAKAAFTTPVVLAPWKTDGSAKKSETSTGLSQQVADVRRLSTIIDRASSDTSIPADVQTSFTTYKALDRLRVLAQSAASKTISSAERAQLQTSFAKGIAQLKTYLSSAPSDLVDISFGDTARQASTVAVQTSASQMANQIDGAGLVKARTDALPGVAGNETIRVALTSFRQSQSFTLDLSTIAQPPTLDGIADAINAQIAAIHQKDADGNDLLDKDGKPLPLWSVSLKVKRMAPDLTGLKKGEEAPLGKWGFEVKSDGMTGVAFDQVDAPDALMVAGGPGDPKTAATTTSGDSKDGVMTTAGASTAGVASTRISKLVDPTGDMTRTTAGMLTALDSRATELLKAKAAADSTGKTKATDVAAAMTTSGIVTTPDGFSYTIGTTSGDLGSNLDVAKEGDLALTKLNSEGKIVWQRTLGVTGGATGNAITLAPDGSIVVAGSVKGPLDIGTSDGDMIVARFDTHGEEKFVTAIHKLGNETANAVAVGADGQIYVGGVARPRDEITGGDAFLVRLDAKGKAVERRTIDSGGTDSVRALSIANDGALLALTGESGHAVLRRIDKDALTSDLTRVDLGTADARALAVQADGGVVVAGATDTDMPGTQVNARAGGRDGFVSRLAADLSDARTTYVTTAEDDQIDSIALMGDAIYAGGRTKGGLSGDLAGKVDGFVARIGADDGEVQDVHQFGLKDLTSDPVRVSAAQGGGGIMGALGLSRGLLTPDESVTLEAQSSVRTGDSFSIQAKGHAARKITIDAGETLTTLASKVRMILGSNLASVSTPFQNDGTRTLKITAKPGVSVAFLAGPDGHDALAKLGLEARRISAPAPVSDDAPRVKPGGRWGLGLDTAMKIDTLDDAKATLGTITQAISYTQSAYRSLYWDDTKAALADNTGKKTGGGGSTATEQKQLANYQAALSRLSGGTPTSTLL